MALETFSSQCSRQPHHYSVGVDVQKTTTGHPHGIVLASLLYQTSLLTLGYILKLRASEIQFIFNTH